VVALFLRFDLPPAGLAIGFASFGPTHHQEEHLVLLMSKLPCSEGEAYERYFEVPHL